MTAPHTLRWEPWWQAPEALAIIERIVANPPRCEWQSRTYVQTRDEWTRYVGADVAALGKVYERRFAELEAADADHPDWHDFLFVANPQKVIAAALGAYPQPCFVSDMADIDALGRRIAAARASNNQGAALGARSELKGIAA